MDVIDFLNKSDQAQIQLLRTLFFENGHSSHVNLMKKCKVSKPSYREYIRMLQAKLVTLSQNNLLTTDKTTVTLTLDATINLRDIYYEYLIRSEKFEVISYLYKYETLSILKLSQKLAISEASLYRKIKELNIVLEEFQLKIKNGQLVGSESQIRYFYFLFFYQLIPFHVNNERFQSERIEQKVKTINEKFQLQLTLYEQKKMMIWVSIISDRYKKKKFIHAGSEEFLAVPTSSFSKFSDVFYTFFPPLTDSWEIEALYNFQALIVFSILPYPFLASKFHFSELPIIQKCLNILVQKNYVTNELHLSIQQQNELAFFLYQLYIQLCFFYGFIFRYSEEQFIQMNSPYLISHIEEKATDVLLDCLSLFHVTKDKKDSKFSKALFLTLGILNYIEQYQPKQLVVGVSLQSPAIVQRLLLDKWSKHLNNLLPVAIDLYEADKTYDLLITDFQLLNPPAPFYSISDVPSNYDLKQIEALLLSIYNQKYN
ncbi:MAG: helix-turn-helix domain-containing protein [Enterococcus sp.]